MQGYFLYIVSTHRKSEKFLISQTIGSNFPNWAVIEIGQLINQLDCYDDRNFLIDGTRLYYYNYLCRTNKAKIVY